MSSGALTLSTVEPAAAATAPSAPTPVSARPGVNAAKVYFTAPATDEDSPVVSYTATSIPEGKTCTAAAAANSCVVPGLTNGQAYSFAVTATNSDGTSAPGYTNTVTPSADTTAPVLVSSHVSPDRASSIAGQSLTVQLRITDTHSGRANPSGSLDANPAILFSQKDGDGSFGFTRSLTQVSGDEYDGIYRTTVTVPTGTASGYWNLTVYPIRDAAGNSTFFQDRPGVLIGAPGAPSNVTAAPAPGPGRRVNVTWNAPSDNGGNVITGYRISDSHTGTTRTTGVQTTSWSGTFPDIDSTEPLTFDIVALNSAGASAPVRSGPITVPAQAPSVPQDVTATRGNQQASVAWSAPASDHGSPITSYTVTASPGNRSVTVGANARSAQLAGLANGTEHTFRVTASNAAGTSSDAVSRPVTPAGVPTTVSDVAASPGDRAATITWRSAEGNGAPVTGYVITTSPGGGRTNVPPGATSATITGLANGNRYTFAVAATNDVGSSAPSTPTAAVVPVGIPLPPPGVTITRGDKKLTVGWTAADGNGANVTGYTLNYNGQVLAVGPSVRSAELTGLTNGTTYRVTVTANNAVGPGTASPQVAAIPAGRPGTVKKPTVRVTGRTVTVTWKTPAHNGAKITGFVLSGGKPSKVTTRASIRKHVYRNLKPGRYRLTVAAKNTVGAGAASAGVTVRVRR